MHLIQVFRYKHYVLSFIDIILFFCDINFNFYIHFTPSTEKLKDLFVFNFDITNSNSIIVNNLSWFGLCYFGPTVRGSVGYLDFEKLVTPICYLITLTNVFK